MLQGAEKCTVRTYRKLAAYAAPGPRRRQLYSVAFDASDTQISRVLTSDEFRRANAWFDRGRGGVDLGESYGDLQLLRRNEVARHG